MSQSHKPGWEIVLEVLAMILAGLALGAVAAGILSQL